MLVKRGISEARARVWLLLAACLLVTTGSAAVIQRRSPGLLDWPQITSQTKPWTRWWWLGNIATKEALTVEMEKYQKAGLGGLEITPIYGVKGAEDRFIQFLSPAWVDIFEHALREGERLGLGIDMATGTGWPFGGPWVGIDDAPKNLHHRTFSLKEGGRLDEPIVFTQRPLARAVSRRVDIKDLKDPISANPDLQALALDQVRFERPLPLVALIACSDRGETLDLTSRVRNGRLDWTATAGNWTLYALFQGDHGKMVERAGPGGEGNVIDHFSERALKNYLKRFDDAFAGRRINSLRAFFNDSYEVDDADGDADWTPDFLAEFEKRRGYDLRQHLPALFGNDTAEKNARVLGDYRETISDLLLERFTLPWRAWAKAKGAIVRNQAHGSPANILDLYAASDIPETEGQEILRMKFASSAAHVTGKRLTSAEAATWLNEHFVSSLSDVKTAVDRFFLGGVNHICYHGTPFSPASEEWPGFLFYASVHFGPTNSFWDDFAALNHYVARCQSFLQSGRPDNDVLLYYPIHDSFTQPSRTRLQHYGGGIESALGVADGQALLAAGYDFDMISDRQLTAAQHRAGALSVGGNTYKAIVLPETRMIPLATFEKLISLARAGATIIVKGELPSEVPGLANLEARRAAFRKLIAQIEFGAAGEGGVRSARVGRGRVFVGANLAQMLAAAGFKREALVDRKLAFVRRAHESGHYYFIVNQGDQAIDDWIPLATEARAVALFDPMREERGMAAVRSGKDGIEVYLQLAPGESRILKTSRMSARGEAFAYLRAKGTPQPVTGTWSVSFIKGGPELPLPVEMREPGSWTRLDGEAVKSFSGTARYAITFSRPQGDGGRGWLLDLGRVAESARVRLNGKDLGVLIKAPYRVLIPADLIRESNLLEVEVSNLMANRIADLDRRGVNWKRFYNINMPARRPENRGADGLFNASKWPPRESGLIGPVTLVATEALRFER